MLATLKPDDVSAYVFIDIAIIVVVARLMGAVFKKLGQPAVVGEIVAGVMLGPSLLGSLPGNLVVHIFPQEQVRPALNVVAQLGLIIFMFIVGLELDTKIIRGKERFAAVVSVTSVALPFVLGVLLAVGLYESHKHVGRQVVDFLPFALFIGASMSVTAFPVLARILIERGMNRTRIGVVAIACAAVDDILAWSILAVVLAVVKSSQPWDLPRILFESLAFVTFMFVVVKPRLAMLTKWYEKAGQLTPNILAVVVVGFLTSAFVTSKIGIHSIFGAFLFGVVMPRENSAALFNEIFERLEQVSVLLLLPVFFVVTGLNVDIRGLDGSALQQLPLILLVACAGKFFGAMAAAKSQGLGTRQSAALGILMNTRGLTELVILSVGREFGVLDEQLFTMLVVMAIVTTIITEPALRVVYPDKLLAREREEAERRALGTEYAYRVLIVTDGAPKSLALVEHAAALAAFPARSELVLSRLRPSRRRLELGSGLVTELAEMTESIDQLNALAETVRARGLACVVRSQFSEDVPRELLEQANAVRPDVVMMRRNGAADDDPLLALTQQDAYWQWVVVDEAEGGTERADETHPVVVVLSGDRNDDAVFEIAARVAFTSRAEMRVYSTSGRQGHAARLAARAQQAGLRVTVATLDGGGSERNLDTVDAGVVVRTLRDDRRTSGGERWTLSVRASDDEDSGRLEELLETFGKQPPMPALDA
ncbi:MAG: cation:proton antiporter [Actinomycetota bacterium]|nr:cation:proton antiporter [Actinomycetota bacterium]